MISVSKPRERPPLYLHSFLLFGFHILSHIGLMILIYIGTTMEWLITLSIYLLTGCIGMSVTYHRLLAHKSWKSSRPFKVFGTLLGFYGLTGSSIAWVAIHRQHHNHVDTPKDPHSPVHQPWWRVQFLSMFSPVCPECSLDLIKDPFHRFLHKYYFFIHALILLVLFLLSPKVAIAAYLAPACLLWHAGSAINTIGHMVGYKNFNTKDQSRNNWPLALLAWGEGWHNNHAQRIQVKRQGRQYKIERAKVPPLTMKLQGLRACVQDLSRTCKPQSFCRDDGLYL